VIVVAITDVLVSNVHACLLTEFPVTDVSDDATSTDSAADLCYFTVWLRRSRVSEESAEKNLKGKSLGVRGTFSECDF